MNDKKLIRSGNYHYIIYPENYSREEYKNMLSDMMLDYLLSPLHTSDEKEFKDHFHLIVLFPNPVSYSTAERIGERLNSAKKILYPPNTIMATRYLIHLDDPDKQQFVGKPDELIDVHGLKAKTLFIKSFSENEMLRVSSTMKSIHNYIVTNHIDNIFLLQQYLLNTDYQAFQLVNQNFKYFDMVCKNPKLSFNIDDSINLD